MRTLLLLLSCLLLLMSTSCSGSENSRPVFAPPTPAQPVVSDAVPSLQELRDSGLSEDQATCFIATIDPDGTGRVASAELFMTALSECTSSFSE